MVRTEYEQMKWRREILMTRYCWRATVERNTVERITHDTISGRITFSNYYIMKILLIFIQIKTNGMFAATSEISTESSGDSIKYVSSDRTEQLRSVIDEVNNASMMLSASANSASASQEGFSSSICDKQNPCYHRVIVNSKQNCNVKSPNVGSRNGNLNGICSGSNNRMPSALFRDESEEEVASNEHRNGIPYFAFNSKIWVDGGAITECVDKLSCLNIRWTGNELRKFLIWLPRSGICWTHNHLRKSVNRSRDVRFDQEVIKNELTSESAWKVRNFIDTNFLMRLFTAFDDALVHCVRWCASVEDEKRSYFWRWQKMMR